MNRDRPRLTEITPHWGLVSGDKEEIKGLFVRLFLIDGFDPVFYAFQDISLSVSGDFKHLFGGLEVRLGCSVSIGHPHTAALARNGL